MPYLYPEPGEKHYDVSGKLIELGGTPDVDFFLDFAWDREHMFAVSDDLFDKWMAQYAPSADVEVSLTSKSTADSAAAANKTESPAGSVQTESPSDTTNATTTDDAATEPSAVSTKDAAADASEDIAEHRESASDDQPAGADESTTSTRGTASKQRAKNSTNRRS